MAKVLDLPHEWIPAALARQTATQLSDTDWVMAGIADFAIWFKETHGDSYGKQRFAARDIVDWAETDDTYSKNRKLTNSWSLAKYLRSHLGTLQSNLGIHDDGSLNNKTMYRVE